MLIGLDAVTIESGAMVFDSDRETAFREHDLEFFPPFHFGRDPHDRAIRGAASDGISPRQGRRRAESGRCPTQFPESGGGPVEPGTRQEQEAGPGFRQPAAGGVEPVTQADRQPVQGIIQ